MNISDKTQLVQKLNKFVIILNKFGTNAINAHTEQDIQKLKLCSVFFDIYDSMEKNNVSSTNVTITEIKKDYMQLLGDHLKEFQEKNETAENIDDFITNFKNNNTTQQTTETTETATATATVTQTEQKINITETIVPKTAEEEELEKEQETKYIKHISDSFGECEKIDANADFKISFTEDEDEDEAEIDSDNNEIKSDSSNKDYMSESDYDDEQHNIIFNKVVHDKMLMENKQNDKFNANYINDESIVNRANTAVHMETDTEVPFELFNDNNSKKYSNGFQEDSDSDKTPRGYNDNSFM